MCSSTPYSAAVSRRTADRRAVGQHLGRGPRPEVVAEGEHVRVRADAGVAEQVPGAADRVRAARGSRTSCRAVAGQVAGHPDAGDAGTDDQDVDVFNWHGGLAAVSAKQVGDGRETAATGSCRPTSCARPWLRGCRARRGRRARSSSPPRRLVQVVRAFDSHDAVSQSPYTGVGPYLGTGVVSR